MKTLSLITGLIIPFVVFWFFGALFQVGFMLGGPKGTSIVLIGVIATVLSLGISYYIPLRYKEKFNRKSLLIGNVIAFILWAIIGYLLPF